MPALLGGFGNLKNSLITINDFIKNRINLFCNETSDLELEDNVDNNILLTNINRINKLRDLMGPYLAGLIEGDGTIVVHDPNSKSKKYNPHIIIVFKKNDLPLANYLQNLTKCGVVYVKPNRGYVLWQIQDITSVYIIISIINGFMRTPKIEALNRTIHWINNYINYSKTKTLNKATSSILLRISCLSVKPLDTSSIDSNAWLSGFTDADGNFSINVHKRTNKDSIRVQLYYRLEISQNYHRASTDSDDNTENSFFPIMSKIGSYLGVTVYSRTRNVKDKKIYSFTVMSHNKLSNTNVCLYFNKFPLMSSKFLDFKDWEYILKAQNNNNLTSSYLDQTKKVKSNFNKTRNTFSWDHLINNSYFNNKE